MNKNILALALSVSILSACSGGGGGSSGSSSSNTGLIPSAFANTAPDVSYALLGGGVNHGAIWSYSGDALWHEVDPGNWRVSFTPTTGPVELTAFVHIRGGLGSCHPRIYNKLRIVRVLPSYSDQIMVDSESLIEMTSGCIAYFDASRTITALDTAPVWGQQNVYAIEMVAGDGLHTEISYGSNFRAKSF